MVARAMSQPLSRGLGQSVVIENRPGANTLIGTEAVMRAPADGNTVLIAGFTLLGNAALRDKPPYDPLKDLIAVAGIGVQPYVFSVHPSLPVKSVKELVALARSRPGELVYATNGYGTGQHLSGELMKLTARIDMKLVVFQGGAPSTIAVLGGHAGILISTPPTVIHHVAAGKLRALAVTSRARFEPLPDVPTMIESGFPEFDIIGPGMGVFAPAGSPREAIDRLGTEVMRTAQLPEVKASLLRDGFVVAATGPAEYAAFVRVKYEQIQKLGKAAKIRLD